MIKLKHSSQEKINPKVALVHDWLVGYAGAEKVLEQLLTIYPEATIFTIVDFIDKDNAKFLLNKKILTSYIQKFPFVRKFYRVYLPFMPLAIEQFNFAKYDIVITNSHAVAKGVLVGPDQLHICYCHSPMRYAWDLQNQYLNESNASSGIKSWIIRHLLHKLRIWDVRSSVGVDHFLANSYFISRRISKAYRRDSAVIYPPVDTEYFFKRDDRDSFYLTASRMVPYKKIPLMIQAFAKMPDRKLIVIGDGPEFEKAKAFATKNVEILGYQSSSVLRDYMQRAKGFVFAAEEDFGITPLEAQACGAPVIAFAKGGVLETIRGLDSSTPTGVFFEEQTVESIINAVNIFEDNYHLFNAESCRSNALRFSTLRFRQQFSSMVELFYKSYLEIKKNGTV